MEILRGKQSSMLDSAALTAHLAGSAHLHIDLGTGDGRYAVQLAHASPSLFVIGVDACRENLRERSRRAPGNCLFVVANALTLPAELDGCASAVSINFPWGSLLDGLLHDDSTLMTGLRRLMRPSATLEVRLNGGALHEAGWAFDAGAARVESVLRLSGFSTAPAVPIPSAALRTFHSTWAKRIAFGRDPRAALITAHR
ncbi:class I SAM-dependent methyltransferase [Anaerolineae bacterium CFX9]|nr:class I SAM-dependent methyltransferase [Anaerolineae bacterium CFX9]